MEFGPQPIATSEIKWWHLSFWSGGERFSGRWESRDPKDPKGLYYGT